MPMPSRMAPAPSRPRCPASKRGAGDARKCWAASCPGWWPNAGAWCYAYANYFRPRLAYRFCVEDSIYLAPAAQGQGVGRLLLAELVARCEAAGARQMLAVIGDAANAGSVGVHAALGFAHTGVLKSAGWKFGRWLDVVLMQRTLGAGDSSGAE